MSEKFDRKMEALDLEEMDKVLGGTFVFCDEFYKYRDFIQSMWEKYGREHGNWLSDLLPQLDPVEFRTAIELYHAYQEVSK